MFVFSFRNSLVTICDYYQCDLVLHGKFVPFYQWSDVLHMSHLVNTVYCIFNNWKLTSIDSKNQASVDIQFYWMSPKRLVQTKPTEVQNLFNECQCYGKKIVNWSEGNEYASNWQNMELRRNQSLIKLKLGWPHKIDNGLYLLSNWTSPTHLDL